jgi:CRISPR/Cas system-associated endoribonuclease Cas2
MPVKIKAAVDKIKAGVDKIKAANVDQLTAADFLELQEELEEYQQDEEDNVTKIKAALEKIKAGEDLDKEKKKALISDLNNIINSDKFFLIFNFGGDAINVVDQKSLNDLRMENTAWERIIAKLTLEVDELRQKSN